MAGLAAAEADVITAFNKAPFDVWGRKLVKFHGVIEETADENPEEVSGRWMTCKEKRKKEETKWRSIIATEMT